MKITNLDVTQNYENLGVDATQFTLTTELGSVQLLEWLNDGEVERVDSHIRINQVDDLLPLFDVSEKPGLMPFSDYLPIGEIHDLLQEALDSAN